MKEWVELKATLHSIHDERFSCAKCLGEFNGRPNGEQMLEQNRTLKACRAPAESPRHFIGTELKFRSCIGNFVRQKYLPWIEAFRQFEKGVMPFTGAYTDQPAKVLELFDVIRSTQMEHAAKQAKKRNRLSQPQKPRVNRGG